MNDPWDVKCVRQAGQYVSCMKINGIPLLPPVLSKECRKEMQYYKLLAKEVEKRLALLKPFTTESDSESSEDKTDAPELPECEQVYELPQEDIQAGFNVNIEKVTAISNDSALENSLLDSPKPLVTTDLYNSITSNLTVLSTNNAYNSPKLVIDLSLSINENGKNILETIKKSPPISPSMEVPERDYNTPKKIKEKELLVDTERFSRRKPSEIIEDLVSFEFDIGKEVLDKIDPYPDLSIDDGPPSLSAKSFTGSLNNIHTESVKENKPILIRQSSYTVLQPSPQLLAHLEVQSLNTGVEMTSISMSESLSNLCSPKKRRSWDLESAKVKWSSMALELNQKKNVAQSNTSTTSNQAVRNTVRKRTQVSPTRSKSVAQDKNRRGSLQTKTQPKSEPIQRPKKPFSSVTNTPSNRTIVKEPINTRSSQKKEANSTKHTQPISESEDPATRVRELYEKIQKQQLIQMANLVEKQKKEQILLQQVFEEQNNLLSKQLKTICPTSPIEVKAAWSDKTLQETDRGPVSLSQLINHKSPEKSHQEHAVSATLADTSNYLSQCDAVLKKSKDISNSIKKQQPKSKLNVKPTSPEKSPKSTDGSRTRTHSPSYKNTVSRKLNYETSVSSEVYEPILTDRTNDTFAGLNVTFPSDSDDCYPGNSQVCERDDVTMIHCPTPVKPRVSTDSAIRSMEEAIHHSMNSACPRPSKPIYCPPTPREITAACYSLHDTFIASTPAERCAMIAADRPRRNRPTPPRQYRNKDI